MIALALAVAASFSPLFCDWGAERETGRVALQLQYFVIGDRDTSRAALQLQLQLQLQ
jgi:hypothetical protein